MKPRQSRLMLLCRCPGSPRESSVQVREIPSSAHFMFYDNLEHTFRVVGEFVSSSGNLDSDAIKA
jgi:hypothetical protein